MPIYDFLCNQCGAVTEQMHRYPRVRGRCLKCGGPARRIYSVRVAGKPSSPFWSKAMGVHPDQIAEERRLHPDRVFNANGDLLVENYQHQKKLAKELGMEIM